MPAPKVEQIGQCLSFQWDEYQLRVTLDRFRDESRGGASAEFQATTTAPGFQPHLTLGQLNLMALRTRTEFARRLKSSLSQCKLG